jgi:hypothetical protein
MRANLRGERKSLMPTPYSVHPLLTRKGGKTICAVSSRLERPFMKNIHILALGLILAFAFLVALFLSPGVMRLHQDHIDSTRAAAPPVPVSLPAQEPRYSVYCVNGKITVDSRNNTELTKAFGKGFCLLRGPFEFLSDAQEYARQLGGEGAACRCE